MTLAFVHDLVLVLTMIWLGWESVHAPNLFRAVVSFMVFGLLAALAWVRLEAPDIALAEAALGAGVTGALLLATLGHLPAEQPDETPTRHDLLTGGHLPWAALLLALITLLAAVAFQLPAPGLGEEVAAAMDRSGVDSPVTAVLLNFRAWDTLLEITVMLLAVVALWSLGRDPLTMPPRLPSATLPALVRLLFPLFLLGAFYLLWRGGHGPGGAFPAGALLAAGLVLLILAGARMPPGFDGTPLRWTLTLGVLAFTATALTVMLAGRAFFEYPPAWAGGLIAGIEVAAGLSIATMLTALFLGGEPAGNRRIPS